MDFVSIVVHDLIDTPAQNFGTFCFAWSKLHDLDIGELPEKNCTKYVKIGLSYRQFFILPELKAS